MNQVFEAFCIRTCNIYNAQISTTYLYTHMMNDQQNDVLAQMSDQIMGNYDEKIEE